MMGSAVQKSATVDEQSHLFRGVAYLKEGATHFLLGHPLTASSLSAFMLVQTEKNLNLPIGEPYWKSGDWSISGDAFLWQLNDNPHRLLFLGRFPVMLATLLLGSVVFRWGRRIRDIETALLAFALILLDPNVIAHGRIISGDAVLTLFFTITLYGFWEWGAKDFSLNATQEFRQKKRYLFLIGLGLGLSAVSKFNGLVLVLILAICLFWLAIKNRKWQLMLTLIPIGIISLVVVWVTNGFAIRPFPGGPFWQDLFWQLQYTGGQHGVYFAGQTSDTGWWFYFPITFLLKEPLFTLTLWGTAVLLFSVNPQYRRNKHSLIFFILPALIYLISGAFSALNIGFRYMLPILPLFALFSSDLLIKWQHASLKRQSKKHPFPLLTLSLLFMATLSIWAYPNYIPFFNRFAGGSQNGWRLLSDSNVDWGQDLPTLARWQAEQGGQPIFLSYFGTAHPSAYGIQFEPIPTWEPTPEQGDPTRQIYNPLNPAPGFYAISVNHLHGVVLGENRDFYKFFREKEPIEKIGNSIFIYEVAANGPPIELVYSHLTPSELAPSLHFESNEAHIRWIDLETTFLWPKDGGWLLSDDTPIEPALESVVVKTAVSQQGNQKVYQIPPPPNLDWIDTPVQFGETITYLGANNISQKDGIIQLMTAWRSDRSIEQPHQIFIHALADTDQIVGQWDGLHSDMTSWSSGDVFVQFHSFVISEEVDIRQLAIGMYDPNSGVRLGEPIFILLQRGTP